MMAPLVVLLDAGVGADGVGGGRGEEEGARGRPAVCSASSIGTETGTDRQTAGRPPQTALSTSTPRPTTCGQGNESIEIGQIL